MKNALPFVSVVALMMATSALSVPNTAISGGFTVEGTVALDDAFASARQVTAFTDEHVKPGSQRGQYGSLPLTVGIDFLQPLNFAGFAGPLRDFWQFSSDGVDYSFDLDTLAIGFQGSFLNLAGQGTAHITGFQDTPAVWRLVAYGNNQRFTFSTVNVPDNGSTAVLIAIGMLGLVVARKAWLRSGSVVENKSFS